MGRPPFRELARRLKRDALVVYFAARHPGTPWIVRVLALAVAAYALSPIDLIPDFIPILGYLDDLVLVPLGVWMVFRLLPATVLEDSRAQAEAAAERPVSLGMATVILAVWAAALGWAAWLGYLWLQGRGPG